MVTLSGQTELDIVEAPLSSNAVYLDDDALGGAGDYGKEDIQEAESELAAAKREAAAAKLSRANARLERAALRQTQLRRRERKTTEEIRRWRQRQEGKAGIQEANEGLGLAAFLGGDTEGGDVDVMSAASAPADQQPMWQKRPRLSRPGNLPKGWFLGKTALTGAEWHAKLGNSIRLANRLTARRVQRLRELEGRAPTRAERAKQREVQRVIRDGMAKLTGGGRGRSSLAGGAPAPGEVYYSKGNKIAPIRVEHPYNYLPMTRDMADVVACDNQDNCLGNQLYTRFLPREKQDMGCRSWEQCELHTVWVHCLQNGAKQHCPEYYWAYPPSLADLSPPAPASQQEPAADGAQEQAAGVRRARAELPAGCVPPLPPLEHPRRPLGWRPTPHAAAEAGQHVEGVDKREVWKPRDRAQGEVYAEGARAPPRGKWAFALPSDDNKLRRTWFGRGEGNGSEGGAAAPDDPYNGTGTLRWRRTRKYAADGAHWLGDFQDPRDPSDKAADSMCGRAIPGVNVYSWGLDKRIRHRNVLAREDHGDRAWYKTLGKELSQLLWGYHPASGKLRSLDDDGGSFERAVPVPFGHILHGGPVALLEEAAASGELDALRGAHGPAGEAVHVAPARLRRA